MAEFTISGLDELIAAFSKASDVPDIVKEKALLAMAEVALAKEKSVGEAKGIRDPESNVHILDSFKITKPKLTDDGGSVDITFAGTRTRNGRKTRNAEIAFINEYGANKRGIPARPFISVALSEAEQKINDAGANVIHDWVEKTIK